MKFALGGLVAGVLTVALLVGSLVVTTTGSDLRIAGTTSLIQH